MKKNWLFQTNILLSTQKQHKKILWLFCLIAIFSFISNRTWSQNWSALQTGLNGSVYAVLSDTSNGEVYAGGSFTNASGTTVSRIAKWNGTSWSDVGGGFDGDVNALHFANGLLYAGGTFLNAGTTPVNHIAVWNGTAWLALGAGVIGGDVLSITDDGSGNIYAAGTFTTAGAVSAEKVAVWNGTSWAAMGAGLGIAGDYVESLIHYNGSIYAGGHFALSGATTVNNISKWDGTQWLNLSGGVTGLTGRVSAMKIFNTELIVGGTYTTAGAVPANSVAKWNGTTWAAIGNGVTGGSQKVKTVEILYGKIFVGGSFSAAGSTAVQNIAGYDGADWFAMGAGVNNQANAMCAVKKDLYVGGAFTIADTLTVNRIAKYSTNCATAITKSFTNPSCFNSCNGSATINATGNAPFTFLWNTLPVQTDSVAAGLCQGTYSVTITDVYGCSITDSLTVTDPAALTLSFTSATPLCYQQCNGTATANVSNAQGSVSYLWNSVPQQTLATAVDLCEGTYTVQITDSAGCFIADSVTITYPAPNALTFSVSNPLCPLTCNGVASVVSTGIAPFTYLWSTAPIQTTDTATGLCSGIYTVIVTDSLGCAATNSVQLTDPAPPVINFTTSIPTCFGSCNGTAVVISTGPAPYIVSWNTIPVQTTQTAVNLCAGTFTATITDSLGCTLTDSITLAEPVPNVLSFAPQNASCAVACNGSATVFSTGYSPFTYNWSNGDTTINASSLCATNYFVTVTDSIGCTATDTVSIGINAPLPIVFSSGYSACNGTCTGSASATLNGFSSLTYLWSTTDTVASIDSLCPGYYSITITDSLGCTSFDSIQITNQPVFLNSTSVLPVCFGQCNGSVAINPSGTPPFNFIWSTGDTTSLQLSNLCAGTYSISITDSAGCVANDSILLQNPPDIIYTTSKLDAKCNGNCDGRGDIDATGGTAPLTYVWNTVPPQITDSVINLCFGYTSYTITDSLGCTKTDSVLILEPSPMFLNPSSLGISCYNVCDGFVTLNPFGGTPGYTYNWSNGFIGNFIGNVCAGTYTVTVTDANFCTTTASYTLTNPDSIQITFTITNASCQGCNDGSAYATVIGGTPPYDPLWPALSITDTIATNLVAGVYVFCVLDTNNCLQCDSVTITEPNALQTFDNSQLQMLIYPNPVSTYATVQITGFENENFEFLFFDVSARQINIPVEKIKKGDDKMLYHIYNNNLVPGIYFIKVFSDNEIKGVGKFIIR